jgi:hypothetical protein
LQLRILGIGRLLWTSSASESPSGRIERRPNSSLLSYVILGLDRERLIDTSKLDFWSYPTEIRAVLSVFHLAKTLEIPS